MRVWRVHKRNNKEKEQGINRISKFIAIFKNSQLISTLKGKSHFLARIPKQTKNQIKINQLEEIKEDAYSNVTLIQRDLDSLQLKIKELESNQRDVDNNADKLSKFYELGLIDANGDPINNSMNLENLSNISLFL